MYVLRGRMSEIFFVVKSDLFIRALLLDHILVTVKTTHTPGVHSANDDQRYECILEQDAREAMRVFFSVLTKRICIHKTKFFINIFKDCYKNYIKLHVLVLDSANYDV